MKKMTLFKKCFLIIFVTLILLEALNIYIDYKANLRFWAAQASEESSFKGIFDLIALERTSTSENQLMNQFQECMQEGMGYHLLVDQSGSLLSEVNAAADQSSMTISTSRPANHGVDLSKLSKEQLDALTSYILNHPRQYLKATYTSLDEYLAIDDELVLFAGEGKKITGDILYIRTPTLEYSFLTSHLAPLIVDYNDYFNEFRNRIPEIIQKDKYHTAGVFMQDYFLYDDRLIYVEAGKLNSDKYVLNFYYADGKFLLEQARFETFYEKRMIYLLTFVIAGISAALIAELLTRRIKKIDEAARSIADNHFEIQLKETPSDELGELSKSINLMSTKLKLTMAQLNEEIAHVKEMESLRKTFIANFTHQMKTPLTIIDGYVELINETKEATKKANYLKAITQETERIHQLVMAMLKLTKLESGQMILKKELLDMEDMIMEVIDEYLPILKKKNVKIILDCPQKDIYADQAEMTTVLHNLFDNALRHVEANGHIQIYYHQNRFTIENEGKPIDEAVLPYIFDTYVSGQGNGTGLGLAICQAIFRLHGFAYGANNTKQGVCFWFETNLNDNH